jgi:prepilin-type processing-associated H-X9-DG protein
VTDDAFVIHIDFQKIAQLVKNTASKPADEKEIENTRNVINSLGLAGVRAFTARAGFKDTDVVIDALLEVPEPRTGLLTVQKPVDLDSLKMVDANAVMAYTCHTDLVAVYDRVLEAVKIASPGGTYLRFKEAVSKFETQSGCSIRNGLLAGLEGPMTLYNLRPGYLVQTPSAAVVAVVSLSDPNLFAANLTALGEFLAAETKGSQAGIQIRSQQLDGRNVQMWVIPVLAYMQVIPCWTIFDNRLLICSNPALIDPVVKRITDQNSAGSLYVSDSFKKIMPALPPKITCLEYINSAVQFNQTMLSIQQFWPMITIAAAHEGINLPLMLPQLEQISQKMQPAFGYSFSDTLGLRYHYRGPSVEQSLMSVTVVSMAAAILMPALAQVRRLAQRIQSAEHLSTIGGSCLVYAQDHNQKYPPDLNSLIENANLPPETLKSPRKPGDFDGLDYIYIPGQNVTMNPMNIIAYENPGYCYEGVNVLYNDGHVEFEKPDQFRKELEETYNRLKRPVPEIKFRNEIGEEID